MRYGEYAGSDQSREAVNAQIAEVARQGVHDFCTMMIASAYDRLREKLRLDAVELDLHELSGFPEDKEVITYVSPDKLYSPMYYGRPQETLTLLLEHNALIEETEEEHVGDRLCIYIPVGREYVYPTPLDPADVPEEMYVEFIPGPASMEPPARYIIQHDGSDRDLRFNLYAYESAADGGEQVIYDNFSDRVISEAMQQRVPENVELAARLLRRIGNFSIVNQTTENRS